MHDVILPQVVCETGAGARKDLTQTSVSISEVAQAIVQEPHMPEGQAYKFNQSPILR